MSTDCYFDDQGCLVCPEVDPTPAEPAQIITSPNLGWNSGANSVAEVAGDAHVVGSIDALPVGMVFGFKTSRTQPTAPVLIDHGIYAYTVAGQAFIEVRERNVLVGQPLAYTLGQAIEIRRVADWITYWVNGLLVASTTAKSQAPLIVNACLYAAGDSLP